MTRSHGPSYHELAHALEAAAKAQADVDQARRYSEISGRELDEALDRASAPIDALGTESLPLLEILAADPRPEVALLAAVHASRIRREEDAKQTASRREAPADGRGAALADSFFMATTNAGRSGALKAIGNEKDPRIVADALVALLRTDDGITWANVLATVGGYAPQVAWGGVRALVRLLPGGDAELGWFARWRLDPHAILRQLLAMPPPVGADAAAELAWLVTEDKARSLAPLLNELSVEARRAMMRRLREAKGPVLRAAFALFVEDPDAVVRRRAVTGLYLNGEAADCPALIRRLADTDFEVRKTAVEALASIADLRSPASRDEVVAALRAHAEDVDPRVRRMIVNRLAWLRRTPWIGTGATDEAKREAGKLAFERALEALGADPGHAAGAHHSVALEDLVVARFDLTSGTPTESEYQVLLRALRHPRALLFARHVCSPLSRPDADALVRRFLNDPVTDGPTRHALLEALASSPALLLDVLRDDSDPELRIHAIRLLEEQATKETWSKIRETIATQPDPRVVEAAAEIERVFQARKARETS